MPEEAYDLYSGTYIKVATEEEIEEALALDLYYFIGAVPKGREFMIHWSDVITPDPPPPLHAPASQIISLRTKPGRALQAYKPGAQPWKRK